MPTPPKRFALLAGLLALGLSAPAAAAPLRDAIVAQRGDSDVQLVDAVTKRVTKLPAMKRPPDAGGGRPDRLLRSVDGRFLLDASISPSGTVLHRYDLATGRTTRLGPFPLRGRLISTYALSRDGKRVAISTSTFGAPACDGATRSTSGPDRVDVLDLADGSVTPVVASVPVPNGPADEPCGPLGSPDSFPEVGWSPNGRTLAVVRRHEAGFAGAPADDVGSARLELHAVATRAADASAAASTPRVLVRDTDEASFAWSPDGRKVAVSAGGELRLVDVASGSRKVITRRVGDDVAFSPSGRRLAYRVSVGNAGQTHVRDLVSGKDVTLHLAFSTFSWAPRSEILAGCSSPHRLSLAQPNGHTTTLSGGLCAPLWGTSPQP